MKTVAVAMATVLAFAVALAVSVASASEMEMAAEMTVDDPWTTICWAGLDASGPFTRTYGADIKKLETVGGFRLATCRKEFEVNIEVLQKNANAKVVSAVVVRAYDQVFRVTATGVQRRTPRATFSAYTTPTATDQRGVVAVIDGTRLVVTVPRVGRVLVDRGANSVGSLYWNIDLAKTYCDKTHRNPSTLCDGISQNLTSTDTYKAVTFVRGLVYNNSVAPFTANTGAGFAAVKVHLFDKVGEQEVTTDSKGFFVAGVVGTHVRVSVSANQTALAGTKFTRGANPRLVVPRYGEHTYAGNYGFSLLSALAAHEEANKPDDCKVTEWLPWAPCNNSTGIATRKRTVTQQPGTNGKPCPTLTQTRKCDVNCTQSKWSRFSACSPEGGQYRTRVITQKPHNNGTKCAAAIHARGCIYQANVSDTDGSVQEGQGLGRCGFSWFKYHPLSDRIRAKQNATYKDYLAKREKYRGALQKYKQAMVVAKNASTTVDGSHDLPKAEARKKWDNYKSKIVAFRKAHSEHEKLYREQYKAFRLWRYLIRRYGFHKRRHNRAVRRLVRYHHRWKRWPLTLNARRPKGRRSRRRRKKSRQKRADRKASKAVKSAIKKVMSKF